MIKKISSILVYFFFTLAIYVGLMVYSNQEKLLFKNEEINLKHKFLSKHKFQEIYVKTADGGFIHSLHFKALQNPNKKLVLYFHGRGANLSADWDDVIENFLSKNHDVLIMDYRGFGKSRGALSEQAMLSDALLIYEKAKETYHPKDIVIYGRSLGTGIATYVASEKSNASCLILEAPYFSILDVASNQFAFVPKRIFYFVLKYHLTTNIWMEKVKIPTYIFHGKKDKLIPLEHSQMLKKIDDHLIDLTILEQGSHNNLIYLESYQEKLEAILKSK
jgi:alpha-beta hydrolase superfamily lysophospholipase